MDGSEDAPQPSSPLFPSFQLTVEMFDYLECELNLFQTGKTPRCPAGGSHGGSARAEPHRGEPTGRCWLRTSQLSSFLCTSPALVLAEFLVCQSQPSSRIVMHLCILTLLRFWGELKHFRGQPLPASCPRLWVLAGQGCVVTRAAPSSCGHTQQDGDGAGGLIRAVQPHSQRAPGSSCCAAHGRGAAGWREVELPSPPASLLQQHT